MRFPCRTTRTRRRNYLPHISGQLQGKDPSTSCPSASLMCALPSAASASSKKPRIDKKIGRKLPKSSHGESSLRARSPNGERLQPNMLFPAIPERPDDAARILQTLLERVRIVSDCIRRHVPLVQNEIKRLFPYGLNAAEIVSSAQHARRAAEIDTAARYRAIGSAALASNSGQPARN